jgi:hypothetical protein
MKSNGELTFIKFSEWVLVNLNSFLKFFDNSLSEINIPFNIWINEFLNEINSNEFTSSDKTLIGKASILDDFPGARALDLYCN